MRQFLSPSMPDKDGLIFVKGSDFRYLKQVLRVRSGDMLTVRLPDEVLINTTVCFIDFMQHCIVLQICSSNPSGVNLKTHSRTMRGVQASEIERSTCPAEYWLFQFIAQSSKMEQIIRQAAECGIKYIIPIKGAYSQKSGIQAMKQERRARLEKIIREARQQSGSPIDTFLLEPHSLSEALALWNKNISIEQSAGFVLWEKNEKVKHIHQILSNNNLSKIALAVGCEGGISPDEMKIFEENKFIPIHFSVNILRCETAALYGIAAVQSIFLERELWMYKE